MSTGTDIKINPATGRKMHLDGKYSWRRVHIQMSNIKTTGTALGPRAARPADKEASLVTEKPSLKKSLAHNKKGRHPPIAPAPRDDPNVARRAAANAVRATALATLTPLPIVGRGHEPSHSPAQRVPVASVPTFTGHLGSNAPPIPDNYGNPLTPIVFHQESLEDRAKNEPIKAPFFSAFTKHDGSFFTFGSPLSPTAKVFDATLDWTSQAPVAKPSPSDQLSNNSSGSSSHSIGSIFDVLGKRTDMEVTKIRSEHTTSLELSKDECASSYHKESEDFGDTTSSVPSSPVYEKQLPQASEQPSTCVSASIEANDRVGVIEVSELEFTAPQCHSAGEEAYPQNLALMLYKSASPVVVRKNSRDIIEPWNSERMFFADTDGFTRLVDMSQTLYDININNDDVDSDFDSIASPNRPIASPSPSMSIPSATGFESPLRTIQDADTASSDDSEDEIRVERLFFASTTGHTRVVDLTQPMYDMDIMVDDGASDFDSEYSPVKLSTSPRKLESPLKIHKEAHTSSSEDDDEEVDMDELLESFRVDCTYLTQKLVEAEGEVTPDTDLSFSEDEDVIDSCLQFISKDITIVDSREDDTPSSDLVETTLGTESLSTFLSYLRVDDNGSTSRLAITAAFLKLVSLEREKVGERTLPASYTAESIMASGIMPHTIFLGTTSLATFISHFGECVSVDDVPRVFGSLSRQGVHFRGVATTGLIAALGRRLGRIVGL